MLDGWAELDRMEPVPGFAASLDAIEAGGLPSSIAVAELLNQGEGFGDVLDCRVVSERSEFGCVAPLAAEAVFRVFGAERPRRCRFVKRRKACWNCRLTEDRGCTSSGMTARFPNQSSSSDSPAIDFARLAVPASFLLVFRRSRFSNSALIDRIRTAKTVGS
jgi:hypothetical protein